MTKLNPTQINQYLDKLFTFVDGLPMSVNGKDYIRTKLYFDFTNTWHFDDEENEYSFDEYMYNPQNPNYIDVKTTYGIQNTTQLKRYMAEFVASLKKARNMKLDKYLATLDNLHPTEKAVRLSKSLAAITRAELFAKYGFDKIKEPLWNEQLKEILGAEINFAKEQAELLTKAPKSSQTEGVKNDEILVVEELENRLVREAVDYKRRIDETSEFDPTYFDIFISGPLLSEYTKALYERMKPLNNQEINKYLTLSIQQFKTHTPPKRHKAFLINYHNTYWYPNSVEYNENEFDTKYATHVWKHYSNYFSQFKLATENVYNDFRAGVVGNTVTAPVNPIVDDNFNIFLKDLEYNYPLYTGPISAYHQWKYNLTCLKKEVLSNLINLEQSARKSYINRLKFELNEELKHAQTTSEELAKLYDKYKTSEEELIKNRSYDNPMHVALYDEIPKLVDSFDEGLNPETDKIRFTFYNYHYGEIIRAAINFLNDQATEHGFGAEVIPSNPGKPMPSATSFNYINNAKGSQYITLLLDSLKHYDLIHKETKIGYFRNVFLGKRVAQKIIWTGNISELAHFIRTLHNTAQKVVNTRQKQWEITINCFKMADGTELTKDKLRTQQTPASAAIIEKAVKIL